MRTEIVTCDACGNEIKKICEYVSIDVGPWRTSLSRASFDLCSDCFGSFRGMVEKFVTKKAVW